MVQCVVGLSFPAVVVAVMVEASRVTKGVISPLMTHFSYLLASRRCITRGVAQFVERSALKKARTSLLDDADVLLLFTVSIKVEEQAPHSTLVAFKVSGRPLLTRVSIIWPRNDDTSLCWCYSLLVLVALLEVRRPNVTLLRSAMPTN